MHLIDSVIKHEEVSNMSTVDTDADAPANAETTNLLDETASNGTDTKPETDDEEPDTLEKPEDATEDNADEEQEDNLEENDDGEEVVEEENDEDADADDEAEEDDDDEAEEDDDDEATEDDADEASEDADRGEEGMDDDQEEPDQEATVEDLIRQAEAKAIADATISANASYVPSSDLMSNPSPLPLIEAVDGIDISDYNQSPSVFTAHGVPIALRTTLDVPIIITNGGSIVEYIVESEDYDIEFGIKAERGQETTIVNALTRVDSHLEAVTGKFLVGTVPCALIFTFSNEYSWFREKRITYRITVTPPTIANITAGRKKRAQCALNVVSEDKNSADSRLERASAKRGGLAEEVERLEKELEEKRKSLDVVEKEENWLKARVELRGEQVRLLNKRLTEGWDDEIGKDTKVVEEIEDDDKDEEDDKKNEVDTDEDEEDEVDSKDEEEEDNGREADKSEDSHQEDEDEEGVV